MNPIDLLGVHPSGALERPVDPRDYKSESPEVGLALAPFDWATGYDVEKDLGIVLPTKDQGSAGSCGGETVSEFEQAISAAFLQNNVEMSAKAPYSQVYVPGGGSNSRMLGEIVVKQGLYTEAMVPSYPFPDTPPTEAFMERVQDISASARADAAKTKGLFSYSFPILNLESMASALQAAKGILIGVRGSNNGTWLSSYPSPGQNGAFWNHFMYGGKAGISEGKKGIWAKQSWGKSVAPETNSYQFISEDHFASGRIWDAMVFHFTGPVQHQHHLFLSDLHFGETSNEIAAAQSALAYDGCFNLKPTGYYGDITRQAVLKFRKKHGIDSSTDPLGNVMGPRTRSVLSTI